MARLVISKKGEPSLTHELDAEKTIIGRVEGNSFVVADPSISGQHCEITKSGNNFTVKDLESTNGTFINGRKITEERLIPGNTLKLGEVEMTFEAEGMTQDTTTAKKGIDVQQISREASGSIDKTFGKKKNSAEKYMIIAGIVVGILLVGALIYALIAAFS